MGLAATPRGRARARDVTVLCALREITSGFPGVRAIASGRSPKSLTRLLGRAPSRLLRHHASSLLDAAARPGVAPLGVLRRRHAHLEPTWLLGLEGRRATTQSHLGLAPASRAGLL